VAAELDFTFSDTVAGYVESYAEDGAGRVLRLRRLDDRPVTVRLSETASAQLLRNLGGSYTDVTGRIGEVAQPGTLVFAYGPHYPDGGELSVSAASLLFTGQQPDHPAFEVPQWWVDQVGELARFYRRAQFGTGPINYDDYRTEIRLGGEKTVRHVQETDTISRLVYGMASAFMLTGEPDFLDVAEAGSNYLRDHLRFVDVDEQVTYWYHGLDVGGARERKLFTSEFADDYQAIPAYEQIYALCGLTQTYRVTGDPRLSNDIEGTVRLFDRFFADPAMGGYFSHIDPVELSPHHESLGQNRSRKNWNSVGDHAPAYLINLYLATGEQRYLRMLEHTFDMIVAHFPDRDAGGSPFVRERFHGDWSTDTTWSWQQDRAVVGHNLKIAWNLTRVGSVLPKYDYRQLAEKLAATMPAIGRDPRRGGWYDVLQRQPDENGRYAFVWHDRKAWWQQEQAILAYLVLAGHYGDPGHLRHAREAEAFYNAFFLDHDEGAVYFNVLANGLPYLLGNERLKGSHSMSMYHSAELCYLATVYNRLLIHDQPLDLWFRPQPDADFPERRLRVAPDLMPAGRVRLDKVFIDDEPYERFDAAAMAIDLPDSRGPVTVRARLLPTGERT
jgi:mannose/cellobiose epimerase-like protein (N-acyl-D-glucosamine 2-epimerase family)